MNVFSSLLSWIHTSGVLAQAEKEAAGQVATAVQHALTTATQHAPDLQEPLAQISQQLLTMALAGIATKAK